MGEDATNDDVDLSSIPGGSGVAAKLVLAGVVLLVLGGVGAGVWWFVTQRPSTGDPVRVRVALRGSVSDEFDDAIRQDFYARLHNFGFDAVEDEAPVEGDDLEAAYAEVRRRALEGDAGTTLLLDLSVEAERPGVVTDYQLYRAVLGVHVVPTAEDAEVRSESAEFTYENTTPENVANGLRDTWFATLAPAAIDLLYQAPALQYALSDEASLPADRMTYALTLQEKEDLVNARRSRVEDWQTFVRQGRDEATRTGSEEDITCAGDPTRPWSVVGIAPDGGHLIVQEAPREPVFRLESMQAEWTEPPESLVVVPVDAPDQTRTLLSVGHFYTLAETSPDGAWASAALFARGVPALVSVKIADGSFGTRWLLEGGERVPFHQPSPDGQSILARLRRGGWYIWHRENALPVPAVRSSRFVRLPSGDGRVVGEINGQLALLEPNGGRDAPWPDLPHRLHEVVGIVGDRLVVTLVVGRNECAVVNVDLETREMSEPVPLGYCLRRGSALADGRLVGAANESAPGDPPGDLEVVVFDPETAETTVITRGTTRDELVYLSADGTRVGWSRRLEPPPAEWDNRIYRRVACWADVPAR